jgi:GxxExxY protein
MEFDELSNKVISCAIEVHKQLGPGLLESSYERCLSYELLCAGIHHETQKELPIDYKGTILDCGYRVDLFVNEKLIVELKAVEKLLPIHEAQVLIYETCFCQNWFIAKFQCCKDQRRHKTVCPVI